MNNRISCFQKTEGILKNNDLLNENYFRNKQKRITNKRESIENKFKKRLSEESYNNNLKITRTTRSLKTPKILKKNSPQIKKRKNKSIPTPVPTFQTIKNSNSNLKLETTITSKSKKSSNFHPEKKIDFQRKNKIRFTFSKAMHKYNNNYKINNKKKRQITNSFNNQ